MIDKVMKNKILQGRQIIDNYREAHRQLHSKGWYEGIDKDHISLLQQTISELENIGFSSNAEDFETKKTEILEKFWTYSDLLNYQELGYADEEDFYKNATQSDIEKLWSKWH